MIADIIKFIILLVINFL